MERGAAGMHELSIVRSIYDVVTDMVREYGINRVKQIKIIAGELTGVEDTTMKSCFEMFVEKTPAEGAKLVIEHVPVKVRCQACGNEYRTRIPFSDCTACGNKNITIISGKELYIDSLEAE